MKSKKLCALVLAILLNACSPVNQSYTIDGKPKEVVSFSISSDDIKKITDSSIVNSNNKFGLKLFSDLVKEEKNKNVFMSPASVALALQMSYNGADKETKDEMAKALEINNLSLEDANNLNKLLIKKLNNPAPDVQLKVANSLWGAKGRIVFKDNFKTTLDKFYNAESKELDFALPKTLEDINKWASNNTNGKITDLIDKIDENVVSYIINAVYFKSNWTKKFKESDTKEGDFLLSDGTKKKVKMMSDFRDYRYYSNYNKYGNNEVKEEDRFEGAEITYGKDSKVSLFLFLPNQKSSLEKFYNQLNNENLEKWLKGFYFNSGFISFPKFKVKFKNELSDNLQSLGMNTAFNETKADFSNMGTSPLGNIYISRVLHNTFIDVNEEGTEAAAATAVENSAASSMPTARFVADRPFFYLIRDNETKSILFMGAVNNPEYE
ncbi:MAG: serpin family protein [Candidatus Sericytochromatia bacterium]